MMIFHASIQQTLLKVARQSINYGLENDHPQLINAMDFEEPLRVEMATFVTLKTDGQLRGCIGTTRPISPLVTSINHNAWSAAYHDPRFAPLTEKEFEAVHISISVLTPSSALVFNTEQELLQKLRPGTDGLIIEKQGQRATFLPSVWELIPDKMTFLAHLKNKAGMKLTEIPDQAWTYQSIQIQE